MSWKCRMVEPIKDPDGWLRIDKMEVGDMFFWNLEGKDDDRLSSHYKQHNSNRPPVAVLLPGKRFFLVDSKCYSQEKGYYEGWQVSGVPPSITVVPSINCVGSYHGYITDGVITDDVEGRKF